MEDFPVADLSEQSHYTYPQIERSPMYAGSASGMSEDEMRALMVEGFAYFGFTHRLDLPVPPCGLPGRTWPQPAEVDMDLLAAGAKYLQALIAGQPGRQIAAFNDTRKVRLQIYAAGVSRAQADADAAYIAECEAGNAERIEQYRAGILETADKSLVYFIGSDGGPIKIGKALDPQSRLKTLQTAHHERLAILATREGGHAQEQAYHRQFASDRLQGEWFAPTAAILQEIDNLSPRPRSLTPKAAS